MVMVTITRTEPFDKLRVLKLVELVETSLGQ